MKLILCLKSSVILILTLFICQNYIAMAKKNPNHFSQDEFSSLKILTKKQLKLRESAGKQKSDLVQEKFQKPTHKADAFRNPFLSKKGKVNFSQKLGQGIKASNLLINGSNSATINIGDSVHITFDFSPGAETAQLMVYIDTNHNGIIDPDEVEVSDGGDLLIDNSWNDMDPILGSYSQVVFSGEDGPNRANADFIFEVNDSYASGTATLSIQQMTTTYSIYGSVIPNRENIVVGVMSDTAVFYTLTNSLGNYTIYVPDNLPRNWMVFSADFLQIYYNIIPPPPQVLFINGSINFNLNYQNATAWLQGTIIDENSNPVPSVQISGGSDGSFTIYMDTTSANGNYLGGAYPESFWFYMNENDLWPNYLARWEEEAVLTTGDTATLDFNVYQTDSYISGHVYLDGNPIWGAKIEAGNWWEGCFIQTYSELDGSYQIPVASELDFYGGYDLELGDIPDYIINNDYYWNINSSSSGIDFNLERLVTGANGYLTDYLTGSPVEGAWIQFYNDSLYFYTSSDQNGYYLTGLLPGTYVMEISHWNYVDIQRFDIEIEDNIISEDYRLVEYGNCNLSGNVTSNNSNPLQGARIDIIDYYTENLQQTIITDDFGNYSVNDFPTGYYFIRCRAYFIEPGYILEYYDNTIFADSANIVYGTPGSVNDSIDFELSTGGGISGTITEEGIGTMLQGSYVRAFDFETREFRGAANADDGSYILMGLPSRDILELGLCDGYIPEFYNNVSDPSLATPIPVTIPNITPNINFTLEQDGSMYKQSTANLTTSLRNTGKFGVSGNPMWPACEWPTGSQDNYLYSGGIWIGADIPGYGISVITSDYTEEFTPISNFLIGNSVSDQDIEIWYYDDGGLTWFPLGIMVHQSSYAWSGEDYIIFKYVIYYDGRYGQINNFYVGYRMDYDICTAGPDTFAIDDMAAYDATNYISYMYDDDGDNGASPGCVGIRILNQTPSMHAYWDIINDPQDDYNIYYYLSSGIFMPPSSSPSDYRLLQAAGPISLNWDDSATVYLAFAAGDSLPGLQNSIQTAVQKYHVITEILDKEKDVIPTKYALKQNYPNPFNPSTTIEFTLPKTEFVTLKIFNTLGQQVATLVNKELMSGIYKFKWNALSFSSGVYFYRIETATYSNVKKLILLK